MNKPIKLTQEIKDPNSLLNKFILFKYNNNRVTLYYIYKVVNLNEQVTIFTYYMFFNKKKIVYSELCNLNLYLINSHIQESFKDYCHYTLYIF